MLLRPQTAAVLIFAVDQSGCLSHLDLWIDWNWHESTNNWIQPGSGRCPDYLNLCIIWKEFSGFFNQRWSFILIRNSECMLLPVLELNFMKFLKFAIVSAKPVCRSILSPLIHLSTNTMQRTIVLGYDLVFSNSNDKQGKNVLPALSKGACLWTLPYSRYPISFVKWHHLKICFLLFPQNSIRRWHRIIPDLWRLRSLQHPQKLIIPRTFYLSLSFWRQWKSHWRKWDKLSTHSPRKLPE